MKTVVYVASEGVRVPVAAERLADLARSVLGAEGVKEAMLSITFVSNAAIARLNRAHLGKRGATDVIAFGLSGHAAQSPAIGDIYIAPHVARSNAHKFKTSVREEIARLVVHGTLHVLGYTHPEGEDRVDSGMWRKQEDILRRAFGAVARK